MNWWSTWILDWLLALNIILLYLVLPNHCILSVHSTCYWSSRSEFLHKLHLMNISVRGWVQTSILIALLWLMLVIRWLLVRCLLLLLKFIIRRLSIVLWDIELRLLLLVLLLLHIFKLLELLRFLLLNHLISSNKLLVTLALRIHASNRRFLRLNCWISLLELLKLLLMWIWLSNWIEVSLILLLLLHTYRIRSLLDSSHVKELVGLLLVHTLRLIWLSLIELMGWL